MRPHTIILALAVAAFAGWLAFWPRQEHADLVRARDALVASDAVVVRFDPGGVAGYRFISLKDDGWLWERTDARGSPFPDAILFDGDKHLLRIAGSCYIELHNVTPPLIPGITAVTRLARQPGIDDQPGDSYVYPLDPTFAARSDHPPPFADLDVTEDLSALRRDGTLRISTGLAPGFIWRGDYSITRASPAELAEARATIAGARPSDYAQLTIREGVVGNLLGNLTSPPATVVIPEHCPDQPTRLWPGANGGQAEGLRATPAPFDLTHGDSPVFRDAATTPASVLGPADYLHRAFRTATFGDVPVTTTDTVLVRTSDASGVALAIISCTPRPWFHC